ncbi:4'-phosphopantetheinyl transferase family protein [Chitinophaga eiseniae]|uniref:4'-phosphopantetheinyl transferase domain-containing protein n=1 Tax=Chitinophaga eiseniae TaxID=634771 RepID=A0A847S8Y7_9BACT|nr:4'-phosphopantetheinyl transferase superfamily protein [Chitinophaga eiseniae]NLR78261.1 hypothetical protein [Chitinophaga eiseniae]
MKEWTNSSYLPVMVTRKGQSFPVSVAISAVTPQELEARQDHFLHADEHTTLAGVARRQYLLGRHAAKLAASHFTGVAAPLIRIRPGVFGQPVLDCPGHNNVQVSISHSGPQAIAVVYPEWHPMAVDIEEIRPDHELPALAAHEAGLVASLPFTHYESGLLLWSAREALSKVLKTGLTTDLALFEISTLHMQEGFLFSTFVHFMQYKAVSQLAGNMVYTLVLPQRSDPDLAALRALISSVSGYS